jgi:hypothetical membrane protein
MSSTISDVVGTTRPVCDPATRVTRSLLGYGVLAGPIYVGLVLAQAAIRPGFDLARHDASLLSNGPLGWIQTVNFIVVGAMVIASGVGVGRALKSRSALVLLAGFGVGLVGAGIFVADPMNGFPSGAPAGMPSVISPHGILHIAFAAVGFLCFVGACMLLAGRFAVEYRRGWAAASLVTGVAFLAAFVGIASGSSSPQVVIGFGAALLLAWTWLAAVSIDLYRRLGIPAGELA